MLCTTLRNKTEAHPRVSTVCREQYTVDEKEQSKHCPRVGLSEQYTAARNNLRHEQLKYLFNQALI